VTVIVVNGKHVGIPDVLDYRVKLLVVDPVAETFIVRSLGDNKTLCEIKAEHIKGIEVDGCVLKFEKCYGVSWRR
jgi:hypothetical protein